MEKKRGATILYSENFGQQQRFTLMYKGIEGGVGGVSFQGKAMMMMMMMMMLAKLLGLLG